MNIPNLFLHNVCKKGLGFIIKIILYDSDFNETILLTKHL
jgi:hypothetical protein